MKYIKVKVFPDSPQEHLEKISDNKYRLFLREPAKQGRANKRLFEIMSKELQTKNIKIVSGHKYMNKILEIR